MRKICLVWFLAAISMAAAQDKSKSQSSGEPAQQPHSEKAPPTTASSQDPMAGMDMSGMNMEEQKASPLPSPHSGSGTGWEPASLPSHEWMLMRGGWDLMAHGVIFIDYNQ